MNINGWPRTMRASTFSLATVANALSSSSSARTSKGFRATFKLCATERRRPERYGATSPLQPARPPPGNQVPLHRHKEHQRPDRHHPPRRHDQPPIDDRHVKELIDPDRQRLQIVLPD